MKNRFNHQRLVMFEQQINNSLFLRLVQLTIKQCALN